ncbi:hypothetical protein M1146_08220 [Patescibacteria group bacterium]|nr:hypothetical protein [Patescibacteria group bacterium]
MRLADLLFTESALKHSRLGSSPAVRLAEGISPTPNAVRECIDDLWVLHRRIEHQGPDQEVCAPIASLIIRPNQT